MQLLLVKRPVLSFHYNTNNIFFKSLFPEEVMVSSDVIEKGRQIPSTVMFLTILNHLLK